MFVMMMADQQDDGAVVVVERFQDNDRVEAAGFPVFMREVQAAGS